MLISRNIPQIDLSRGTKILTRHSCHGVERDQAGIECRFEDSAFARSVRGSRWIQPRCYTSIDKTVAIVEALVDIGIKGPKLLSGGGIKGDNPVEGSGELEPSIKQNRGGLRAAPLSALSTSGDVSGMENPRDLELHHIFPVDLRKGGMPHPSWIIAVSRPIRISSDLTVRIGRKTDRS